MKPYTLSPQFLRDFQTLEPDMSPADVAAFDALMATIMNDPQGVRRVQSFYDPARPSWLTRSGPFVVHYAYNIGTGDVTFLNLFRRS